jgi:hypothetical protein
MLPWLKPVEKSSPPPWKVVYPHDNPVKNPQYLIQAIGSLNSGMNPHIDLEKLWGNSWKDGCERKRNAHFVWDQVNDWGIYSLNAIEGALHEQFVLVNQIRDYPIDLAKPPFAWTDGYDTGKVLLNQMKNVNLREAGLFARAWAIENHGPEGVLNRLLPVYEATKELQF